MLMEVEIGNLFAQFIEYLPLYVALVLVPAILRGAIERFLGIELRDWSLKDFTGLSFDIAFEAFILTVFFMPLFEELIFRGIPYLLFGAIGAILGSAVWVIMHPAWQLRYVASQSISKKLLFIATTTAYYALSAVFYTMLWITGAGLLAIIYHMFHNGWVATIELLKEIRINIELPLKKQKYKFIRRTPIPRHVKLSIEDIEEEEIDLSAFTFVRRRSSIREEVEDIKRFMFVKRRE